jgi:hypothetical protein
VVPVDLKGPPPLVGNGDASSWHQCALPPAIPIRVCSSLFEFVFV